MALMRNVLLYGEDRGYLWMIIFNILKNNLPCEWIPNNISDHADEISRQHIARN